MDRNDERGSSGCVASVQKSRIIVADQNTDDENTKNVEYDQSEKDPLDGFGYGLSGVLGFSECGGDDFGTEEGECSLDQTGEPSEELSLGAGDDGATSFN